MIIVATLTLFPLPALALAHRTRTSFTVEPDHREDPEPSRAGAPSQDAQGGVRMGTS
jgi:hypothetical protein